MATSSTITVKVIGDKELEAKLDDRRADGPRNNFLNRGAIYLQGRARKHVRVDTGRAKNSIGIESPVSRMRKVGPSVEYGEALEFGSKPHTPPKGSLSGWARRKGLDENEIMHKISIAGTKAHPFMKPAADETETYIQETLMPTFASEMEAAFQ